MDQKNNALRVNIKHEVNINAPAADIFPLACPVREEKWIDQWHYELIYSSSGFNENNCIFSEQMSFPVLFEKPGTVHWHTVLYDPDAPQVNFLLTCGDMALIKWETSFMTQQDNSTQVSWNLIMTSLCREVDEIGQETLCERLLTIIMFLGEALKHYCETGEMLKLN